MVTVAAVFATMLAPILVIVALLSLAAWRDRAREAATARQIRLTDVIAHELGAIVAPVVTKPLWGPWKVQIAVPFRRPSTVARVLSIAHQALERMTSGRYEIVLTPQEPAARPVKKTVVAGSRLRVA